MATSFLLGSRLSQPHHPIIQPVSSSVSFFPLSSDFYLLDRRSDSCIVDTSTAVYQCPYQSTFVPSRFIADPASIFQATIHLDKGSSTVLIGQLGSTIPPAQMAASTFSLRCPTSPSFSLYNQTMRRKKEKKNGKQRDNHSRISPTNHLPPHQTGPILALASLILIGGACLLVFFVILAGAVDSNPVNQIFFLEADTSSIPGAPSLSRWTLWNICTVNENGRNLCPAARPAFPLNPPDSSNFGTTERVPDAFLGYVQ